MDIHISSQQHQAQVAHFEHLHQYLRAETERLQAELRYVQAQHQHLQAAATAFVEQVYQVDTSRGFTLDSARGVIVVPDPDPDPDPTPADEARDEPGDQ